MSERSYQRVLLLVIAVVLTAAGLWGLYSNQFDSLGAIMMRAGFVLFVIWLAMPQLTGTSSRGSLMLVGLLGLIVLVAVTNKRFLPLVVGTSVLYLLLQTVGKRFTRALGNRAQK